MTTTAEPMPKRSRRAKGPLRTDIVVQEAIANVVLLAIAWWLGMGFATFLLLLAGETVIVMMLGSSLHGRRPLRWYVSALVSLAAGLAVAVAFEMLVYGVLTAAARQSAFDAAISALRQVDLPLLGWGLLYAVAHLAIALVVAMRRPDPRVAFAQQGQMQAGVNMLALFVAIPAILLGGALVLAGLTSLGLDVPIDAVAVAILVLLRFALLLRFCRYSEQKWSEIADSFYR